ncbi:MAG: hypothetical protein PHR68_04365 [Candidatus Gracilibacteria bacterium]|nr:hypothetical protein [Candidatus Gracilibacteria bacterium]
MVLNSTNTGSDELESNKKPLENTQETNEQIKAFSKYPTEKLEQRRNMYFDKIKSEMYEYFIKNDLSTENIDFIINFMNEYVTDTVNRSSSDIDNENGKTLRNYSQVLIDIGDEIRLKLIHNSETDSVEIKGKDSINKNIPRIQEFLSLIASILKIEKNDIGSGLYFVYDLPGIKKLDTEITENKMEESDEYWIEKGMMTPKVKNIFYKIREIAEKYAYNPYFAARPEDWLLRKNEMTDGKIVVIFNSSGYAEKIVTPYGVYTTIPMPLMSLKAGKEYIKELNNNFDLQEGDFAQRGGGYKLELDY